VLSYDEESQVFCVRYVDMDGRSYTDVYENLSEVKAHLDNPHPSEDEDAARNDDYNTVEDVDDESLQPPVVETDDASEDSFVPSVNEEATGDDDEILAEIENPEVALADGVPETDSRTRGGPSTKRATYPQVGTTGRFGNAQDKPFFRVQVSHDMDGCRVIPILTQRCTRMAQMYMPFAKHFINKATNLAFFKSLWRLTLLCLQCFSPLHTVIFSEIQANAKHPDPVKELTGLLKQVVQSLEDYKESLTSEQSMYSRWEVTIEIDLSAPEEEVPTLPIQPGTCPLDALVVVEASKFRSSLSNFLYHLITPLRTIAMSDSTFRDVSAVASPNAKAGIICLIEMAVNTLGGGGVGKSSVLGILLKDHAPGSYDSRYLSPLVSDLTKISHKDHLVTGLLYGISPEFIGFQYELDEATDSTAVTISKTTEFHVSRSLRCAHSFLECLQRIFGRMTFAAPTAVAQSQQTVSFLQAVEFPRIAVYNVVQVKQLLEHIAVFLLKLYRSEWADIIASKCSNFPFTITSTDGQDYHVSSPAQLFPHLVGICSDRTFNLVWPSLKSHLKLDHQQTQKPVDSICEFVCWPSSTTWMNHSAHAYCNLEPFEP
jgi:hypothetical protein